MPTISLGFEAANAVFDRRAVPATRTALFLRNVRRDVVIIKKY
jgi:hypothetical protein